MKSKRMVVTLLILLIGMPCLLLLTGCGGGGASSSSASGGTGTVAILLTDGPAEDFSVIEVAVTEISIQPEGEDEPWVVIFQDPMGHLFNLLDLRDQNKLLTVSDDVPAGRYSKIRMRLSDHFLVKDKQDNPVDMELKIPSGKIDLNPQGSFEVVPGEMLSITLDLDANKSINFHPAGKSGKWIFRPVVFVEVETVIVPEDCPQILKGKIDDLYTNENGIEGFVLFIGEGRNPLDVFLADDAVIFGEDGLRTDAAAIEDAYDNNLTVHVRGWLDAEGDLQASVVVVGDFIIVKGTVGAPLDGGVFPLVLDPGQVIVDETIDVTLSDATFVMTGCDEQVPDDEIRTGMTARVVGKISITGQTLQAVAVLLKPQYVTGYLTMMDSAEGGYVLTVEISDTETVDIFLPANLMPYMENIGEISIEDLQALLACQKIEVNILVSSVDPEMLTAIEFRVVPEQFVDTVRIKIDNPTTGVITNDLDMKVLMPATIRIVDQTGEEEVDVTYDAIGQDDTLLIVGFPRCPLEEKFYNAYMVYIQAKGA